MQKNDNKNTTLNQNATTQQSDKSKLC